MSDPAHTVSALLDAARSQFRAWVLDPAFVCVGAKSAVQRDSFRLELYPEMGGTDATDRLSRDLAQFVRDQEPAATEFSTFAASFVHPGASDERTFEALLWRQLQELHARDTAPWDPDVASDPSDGRFAFSFAGRAFFVVGLHPGSSRMSRRFAWPTLVFNARFQFEHLRERGKYERMQGVIRARDRALQGTNNPMLSDFGSRSEARQYSGRSVEEEWRCPFHPSPAEGSA